MKNYFELKKRRINIVNSCIFTSQILSSLLCTFLDMHLLSKWPKYFNHGAEKCYLWRCYLNKHIREERYSVLTTANLKIQGHSENLNNSPWGHIAHLGKNSYNWFNQLNHILFMVKIQLFNCFSVNCVNNLGNEVIYTQVSAYLAKLYFKDYLLYFPMLKISRNWGLTLPTGIILITNLNLHHLRILTHKFLLFRFLRHF